MKLPGLSGLATIAYYADYIDSKVPFNANKALIFMFKDFHNSLPNFFHLFWKHVIIPACKTHVEK